MTNAKSAISRKVNDKENRRDWQPLLSITPNNTPNINAPADGYTVIELEINGEEYYVVEWPE